MSRARAVAWSSCNRVSDEQWHDSWQAHRERIEYIQTASSVSAQAFSSALAASGHPHRIHKSKINSNGCSLKAAARSKSPAARARQKQIDRENLILIKKIIAIDNAKASGLPGTATTKKKRPNSSAGRSTKATTTSTTARNHDRNTIVVPAPKHSDHVCKQPLAEVPQNAASHALYTRSSATMKNNFAEYNTATMLHASNSSSATARVRSRAQAKILNENKKILRRILTARSTVSRSDWRQHEEQHNKFLTIMSRHNSTSKFPQRKSSHHQRALRISRSQGNLHEESRDGEELLSMTRNNSESLIRTDHTSHLTQQKQQRPRSASAATGRTRSPTCCPLPLHTARTSGESVVDRMRRMTIESQCDDEM